MRAPLLRWNRRALEDGPLGVESELAQRQFDREPAGVVHLAVRAFYMQRLFHGFGFARHAARAFAPTLPAVGVVLALRALEPGGRTLELALGELALYLGVTAAATWYLEAPLLREAVGYVFGGRTAKVAA